MRKLSLNRLVVTATMALAIAVGGCGESDEDRIKATIEGLQKDFAAGDIKGVCAAMGDKPRRQIGTVGHARKPTSCVADMNDYLYATVSAGQSIAQFEGAPPPPNPRKAPKPTFVDADVSGGRAVARLTLDGHPLEVPLVKEDGDWKLDDFFLVTGPVRKDLR